MNIFFSGTDRTSAAAATIRLGMLEKLPKFLQPIITWLTGKALPDEKPLIKRSNFSHIIVAYLFFFAGLLISYITYRNELSLLLMVLGWILTVSGARRISTVVNHYLVHKDVLPIWLVTMFPKFNHIFGDFNSAILFLNGFAKYVKEHIYHHKVKVMATMVDPDMIFLYCLGFRPGMTVKRLWLNYLVNILFPFSKLHVLFIKSRIIATFSDINLIRFIAQILVIAVLIAIAMHTSVWTVIWVWVFPLTYIYHIAALHQFLSEHLWCFEVNENGVLDQGTSKDEQKKRSKTITVGRFCGEAVPNTAGLDLYSAFLLWCWWFFRMLFVHLIIRLVVLPGDLAHHDVHHVFDRRGDDWANSTYSRDRIIRGLDAGEEPLREVWGLKNVIDLVFIHFSQAPAISPLAEEINKETILAM